jgi:uncharacterized protein DUF5694
MATPARYLLLVLFCISVLATAQQRAGSETAPQDRTKAAVVPSATGRYEGTATNSAQQVIPVVIDLTEAGDKLSGEINSTHGNFPIVGGTRQGDAVTIEFDVGGEKGTISAKLTGGRLLGTFTAGDDGGPVDLRKTTDVPGGPAADNSPITTPILFLGVYHMANPGLDEVNTLADDVLAPKRPQEIEELTDRLARFRPTKITIEAPYRDTYWPDRFQKYLAGQYTLGRNEIEQIAFRLAKQLKLSTVYGIDFQMFANGLTPSEMELPGNKDSAGSSRTEAALSPEEQLLRQSTVTEYLAHLNRAAEVKKNHEGYMTSLLPTSDPAIYQKADLVANWYKRNLRIFANINRITEPGKDRVLVIIGAGHLRLLKEFAADSPYFDLADTESFLK